MDAGRDPKVPTGGPLVLENAEFDLNGIAYKRTGSARSADPYDFGAVLGSLRGLPVAYGSFSAPRIGSPPLTATGNSPMLDVGASGLPQTRRDAYYYVDVVRGDSVVAIAYTTKASASSYSVYVETYSASASPTLLASYQAYTGTAIRFGRVLKVGSNLRYYVINAAGELWGGTIDASTGAVGAKAQYSAANPASTTILEWDACAIEGDTGYGVIAYASSTAGKVSFLICPGGDNPSAVAVDITEGAGAILAPSCWRQSASTFAVGYALNNAGKFLKVAVYDKTGATVLATTQVDSVGATFTVYATSGVATNASTGGTAYWSVADTDAIPLVRKATYTTSGAGAASVLLRRARLAAKPGRNGITTARHYVAVYARSWGYSFGAQDTLFFIESVSLAVAGKALVGTARTGDSYGQLSRYENNRSTGQLLSTACEWITQVDNSVDHKDLYQISMLTSTASYQSPRAYEAGSGRMLIPNSCPHEFDGSSAVEQGFLMYPEPFSTSSTSGGSMSPGTYLYRLVYEWVDGNGSLHQSSPSPEASEITLSTGTAVIVTCPTLTLTQKTNVQIAVYRTKAGGITYYRVGAVANDTTANTVTYTDTQTDSFIGDMGGLYTDSGELPNLPPRPTRVHCVYGNRRFHVDRFAEATDIYYSKRFSDFDAVNECGLMRLQCDPAGGAITALAGFLDKLIIFKRNRIYAAEGDGYDNAGGGSNYATPWLVNPSVGCSNPTVLALTPMGLVFLGADQHLWLLDHSLQCSIFSDAVHYYMDTLTPCSLVTEPAERLLHCFTSEGTDLVWDWDKRLWSVWTWTTGATGGDAVDVNGVAYWLDADGYLWHHDTAVYADNGTRYTLACDTGFLSGGGMAGMSRMYWLLVIGQNVASHTLRVQIAYDDDPTWLDDQTFSSADLTPFDVSSYFGSGLAVTYEGQAYAVRAFTSRPTCSSMRVRVSDSAGTGNTWSLSAIALVAGAKPGSMRVDKNRVM